MDFIFPIKDDYKITQKFGEHILDYSRFGMKGHNGWDVACARKTPVYASIGGVVRLAAYDASGAGNYVSIFTETDTLFLETAYFHLLSYTVKQGEMVTQGQLIGFVNSTGFSTGDHLHFGLRPFNKSKVLVYPDNGYKGWIDPIPYFQVKDEVLPVDLRYGQLEDKKREQEWSKKYDEQKVFARAAKVGFGPSEWDRMKLAFVYGYWDDKFVFDVANFAIWANWTKPTYEYEIKGRPNGKNYQQPIM